MYIPESYKIKDFSELYAFMSKWNFADLVTVNKGTLNSNKIPLLLDKENNCLYGHLGRTNDQLQQLETADDLLVIFSGLHSYVSPRWHHNDGMVPTWNFETVQVKGKASLLEYNELITMLEQLTKKHEGSSDSPWAMDELDTERKEKMLNAIVGFKIDIVHIEGKQKFSQIRSKEDRQAVVNALSVQKDQMAMTMATVMQNQLEE